MLEPAATDAAADGAAEENAPSVDLDGIWPEPERSAPRAPLPSTLPWVLLVGAAYALLVAEKARAVQAAAGVVSDHGLEVDVRGIG